MRLVEIARIHQGAAETLYGLNTFLSKKIKEYLILAHVQKLFLSYHFVESMTGLIGS